MEREKLERFRRSRPRWRALVVVSATLIASTLAPAVALAQPSLPAPACTTAEDETASRESFTAGKRAYDVADYDKAISLYVVAYSKDCRRHGILTILSGAYEKTGDTESALFTLRAYLERLPTADDRDAIAEKIGNLEKRVATRRAVAPTAATGPAREPSRVAISPALEERKHAVAPWVLVGIGGVAVVVGAIVVPVGLASNDGVAATDDRGNPLFAGGEPVMQRCATFGGECRAYVAGTATDDPRYAVPDRAARERTHPATQAALAARDTAITGLVMGGVGLFALSVGLVWHYTEPTGLFAKKAASALTTVHPIVGSGLFGAGLGTTF